MTLFHHLQVSCHLDNPLQDKQRKIEILKTHNI